MFLSADAELFSSVFGDSGVLLAAWRPQYIINACFSGSVCLGIHRGLNRSSTFVSLIK